MTTQGTLRPRRARWPWALGAAAAVAGLVWVAISIFGVHKLFVDDTVDEAGPVFDSGVRADAATPGAGDEATTGATDEGDGAEAGGSEVVTLATGTFEGRDHPGEGTVTVVTDGTDQRFLRLEDDFATDNGPDLFVYLGTGSEDYGDASQYVELGTLKGNQGAQNYEIPPEVDLSQFSTVAVWCKRFDSTFTVATLELA